SSLGSGASAWSTPKKISGSYDADRGTLATQGSNVYAAWTSQKKYYKVSSTGNCTFNYIFSTADPRFDYFRASTNNGSTWAKANFGYSQAAGDPGSGRMVFTWTTAGGAFSDVWTDGTGGSFGGAKTIVTFPDTSFSTTKCGSTTPCNAAGSGAIPVLLGSSG